MNKHRLRLVGGARGELRVPAEVLQDMVAVLLEGARQATRFVVEGESTRAGPRPGWLDAACHLDVTGLSEGSAILALEAPTLEETDPARFGDGQGVLFEEPGKRVGKRTAVELFGEVLASVIEGDAEEVLADRALLDTCARFAKVARGPFGEVHLEGLGDRVEPVVVGPQHVARIEQLRDATPGPQAVRVTGMLDTISASRSDVVLVLPDGARVPARMEEHDAERLHDLFGTRVTISGIAHYRPTGQLLMIDIESLEPAREADELFASAPVAKARRPVAQMVAQDETSGVAAFFGTWPGDESEEDLLEALRELR